MTAASAAAAAALDLEPHRALLWAIAYRMTGVAADADDVVQEAFAKALAHPPKRDRSVRPWLVKVAMNAARDALRRRRRREYVGPWLPSPVDDDADRALESAADRERPNPEQRYSIRESATFAFLLAVEQLTPLRRAVLILRDVFEYSGEETAAALGISVDAVKQNLSRARKALAEYDGQREDPATRARRNEKALHALFFALARGDTDAVEELLADDVQAWSDGGGVYTAARVILRGPEKVALVYLNLTRLMARFGRTGVVMRRCNDNAIADLKIELDEPAPPAAQAAPPRTLISVDTDHRGKIIRVYSVMAPGKLSAVAPLSIPRN